LSRRVLVGVDQGTTGTRTVVFDERLRPVGESYREIHQHYPRPGWVEHDPDELVESVAATVADALAAAGSLEVAAVGLANQGETTVAWDAPTGRPLGRAIVWQDRRTEPILASLRERGLAEEVERRSGLPLDPYFSSSKMTWLLEQEPLQEAASTGRLRLGTSDAFLRDRLTGRHATDPATASRTQLLDLAAVRWDERLAEAFAVPLEALPAIEPTAGDLGELRAEQWSRPLPLAAAIVDQQAALAGHACFEPGSAKCTYGTGCFLLSNAGDEAPPGGHGLLPTVAWTLDGRTSYALDGGVLAAGTCVNWLVSAGLLGESKEADALAGTVESSGGVRFLPAFSGLGAPWWRSEARGVFAGITAGTGRGHLVRAVLEGIAFRVRDIVEAGARLSGERPTVLRVDGGLTGSRVLMQTQADLLGIPLLRAPDAELTALGAAALAGIGAGVIDGPDELVALLPEPETIEPARDDAWREEVYADWLAFLELAAQLR
jgi:glycerol kinase